MWFLVYEIRSNFYFTFVVYSGHGRIQKMCMLGGSVPLNPCVGLFSPQPPPVTPSPTPDAFGLNHPSQLVTGYHWLAFLNQFHKNLPSSQFNTNVGYKIDLISKNKSHTKKLTKEKNPFQNIFWDSEKKIRMDQHSWSDHISWTENRKNRKIDFSFA